VNMRRILITGAGGFIGSHLARELHRQGHFVRVVDIKWDGYLEEPYYSEKCTLDMRDYASCLKATVGVEDVYNLAADMGGIGYITAVGADVMHNSGLLNTNMLQAAVENKVARFFFSSSACVYPEYKQLDPDVPALREEDAYPAAPDSYYGWEKLFTEKLCEAYAKDYGLYVRVARFHNVYGPNGTWNGGKEKAPAALCRKVAEAGDPGVIDIWGDGKQTRSFCYIDDCVRGVLTLMESDHDAPINIGSERLVTIDELADMVITVSGKRIEKEHEIGAPQGVRGRNADLTLARRVLKWEPHVDLEEGLARTYSWIEEQVRRGEPVEGRDRATNRA